MITANNGLQGHFLMSSEHDWTCLIRFLLGKQCVDNRPIRAQHICAQLCDWTILLSICPLPAACYNKIWIWLINLMKKIDLGRANLDNRKIIIYLFHTLILLIKENNSLFCTTFNKDKSHIGTVVKGVEHPHQDFQCSGECAASSHTQGGLTHALRFIRDKLHVQHLILYLMTPCSKTWSLKEN